MKQGGGMLLRYSAGC